MDRNFKIVFGRFSREMYDSGIMITSTKEDYNIESTLFRYNVNAEINGYPHLFCPITFTRERDGSKYKMILPKHLPKNRKDPNEERGKIIKTLEDWLKRYGIFYEEVGMDKIFILDKKKILRL